MTIQQILGERMGRRVKQYQLAKALGLKIHTLVDIERGRVSIDDEMKQRMMDTIEGLAAQRETAEVS